MLYIITKLIIKFSQFVTNVQKRLQKKNPSIPNPKFMFLLEDDSAMCCEIVECRDWNDTYRLCIVARCAHHSLFESVDDTIALLCSPLITKIRNIAKMISAPLCPTCAVPKRLGKHPKLSVPELSQLAQRKNIEPRQTT